MKLTHGFSNQFMDNFFSVFGTNRVKGGGGW